MFPRCASIAVLAVGLLGTGCSSTLNEYRCASDLDCIGDEVGQCEASGHCSFVDDTCPSGFRFGDNAGSETDSCVEEEQSGQDGSPANPVDAGTPDAVPTGAPVADIRDVSVSCGRTTAVFDGSDSYAQGSKTLVDFEWTLLNANEDILDRFGRSPNDTLWGGIHRYGGTYRSPRINIPAYHEKKAFRLDVNTTEVLAQSLDTTNTSAPHRFSFAVASETMQSGVVTAQVLDSMGVLLAEEPFSVNGTMTAHVVLADDPPPNISQPVKLQFAFSQPGRYWIDNISAIDLSDGEDIVRNGSAEVDDGSWSIETGMTSASAVREDLPQPLRQNGVYKVQLQVTDSDALRSAPKEVEVTLQNCP